MNNSPYLDRKPRSLLEYQTQRLLPETRLREIHDCIERAEMELRKLSDEYGDNRNTRALEAVEGLGSWFLDYLKPLEETIRDAEEEGRESAFIEQWLSWREN